MEEIGGSSLPSSRSAGQQSGASTEHEDCRYADRQSQCDKLSISMVDAA